MRVHVVWTQTARDHLAKLPYKARRGLLEKADQLLVDDVHPKEVGKPLVGPLQGFYRIRYSRYRAVYDVREEDGQVHVTVRFVIAGVRKEGDKRDIYALASRLRRLGLLEEQKSVFSDDET